jgi:hypothetical protein
MKRSIRPKSVVVHLTHNPLWLSEYLKTQFVILSAAKNLLFVAGQTLRFAQGDSFDIFS